MVGQRIAAIGKLPNGAIGPKTSVIDASGQFLAPGFMDAHIHFESSMLTYTEFVNLTIQTRRLCRFKPVVFDEQVVRVRRLLDPLGE
jgi:adenine deaminase